MTPEKSSVSCQVSLVVSTGTLQNTAMATATLTHAIIRPTPLLAVAAPAVPSLARMGLLLLYRLAAALMVPRPTTSCRLTGHCVPCSASSRGSPSLAATFNVNFS